MLQFLAISFIGPVYNLLLGVFFVVVIFSSLMFKLEPHSHLTFLQTAATQSLNTSTNTEDKWNISVTSGNFRSSPGSVLSLCTGQALYLTWPGRKLHSYEKQMTALHGFFLFSLFHKRN